MDEYTRTNLENWEARVPIHAGPGGYDLQRYVDDPSALSGVVEADVDRLGDLSGLRVATCSATSVPTRSRSHASEAR